MKNQLPSALIDTLVHASNNSPYYIKQLGNYEFDSEFNYSNFAQLPFTTKEDLSANNKDFLAIPKSEIAEFVTTSGTSGEPVTIYLSKSDLDRLAENERFSLASTGATQEDVFQLMTTIDRQFMAGLAYYLGVQALGAGLIRIGPGVPALQWKSIFLNEPTVLIAVPSFIISLIEYAKENNIELEKSSVKSIVCIGEAIREDDLSLNILGRRITENWKVELFSTYASTEMGAAFTECREQKGGHLNAEIMYLEVIDENDVHVNDNEVGEIVITTLGTEGTPLIRYRTGDLARYYASSCQCGIDSPRLGPIIGRKNQMIKFKGTTLFPKAIFEIFDGFPAISCYKVEVSKDYLGNDTITVLLEKKVENATILKDIIEQCKAKLRVVPHFVYLDSDYLRSQVFKKNIRKPEKIIFK